MDVTPGEWVRLALSVAGLIGGAAVWIWGRDRAQAVSSAVAEHDAVAIVKRLDALDARFDKAGQKTSDAADRVLVKMAEMSERLARIEALYSHRGAGT